ncbi:hypothetical protein K3495_g17391 [Podosphaera aphanis]|nr:hypothetical protein K3495_g17391 [Podosphaera aphanis]
MGNMKIDLKQLTEVIAVLNASGKNSNNGSARRTGPKPSAPWRTEEEILDLREKGVCLRCEKPGHVSRFCRKYGPPKRPAHINNVQDLSNFLEESTSSSGKD